MDFWGIVLFCFLTFLIMSCCGYCCSSKQRGAVLSTPVVVTSATHTTPGGYVTQIPPPGYQSNLYATTYPTQTGYNTTIQMPMPGTQPPPGMPAYMAPYPMAQPANMATMNMNPPSYDVAVSTTSHVQPTHYEKQAPYNPNFAAAQ